MAKTEEQKMAILGLMIAFLLASHWLPDGGWISVVQNYLYWISRVAIQAVLFALIRSALERFYQEKIGFWRLTGLAIALSHIPYVLCITAMDIVLGFPELGIGNEIGETTTRLAPFFWELVYLFDNHLAVCLLLSLPRLIPAETNHSVEPVNPQFTTTLLSKIDPPLSGKILWIEAQEHYVRLSSDKESRMMLARFSDLLNEMPSNEGMQVHRSHWVAYSAVEQLVRNGQSLTIVLTTGDSVPVSRSYQKRVRDTLDLIKE